MKVALLIQSLGPGGAERIISLLADDLAAAGHQVTLFLLAAASEPRHYQPSSEVEVLPLGITTSGLSWHQKILSWKKASQALRQSFSNFAPDIVISFMDQANLLAIKAVQGTAIPVVVAERVNPAFSSIVAPEKPWLLRRYMQRLRNELYQEAASIVVQTERAADYFPSKLGAKVVVIPNPVVVDFDQKPERELDHPVVVGMGRLVRQKRFDLLISAFLGIAEEFPEWKLVIFGDGPEKEDLLRLARSSSLSRRVHFFGVTQTPNGFLKEADLFVLSSDFEGFPGALCEAVALGTAAVSSDCDYGPKDIFGQDGGVMLFQPGSVPELQQALRSVMSDATLRAEMSAKASEIVNQYTRSTVSRRWTDLIAQVVQASHEE